MDCGHAGSSFLFHGCPALGAGGSGVHAVVIGVSEYLHLDANEDVMSRRQAQVNLYVFDCCATNDEQYFTSGQPSAPRKPPHPPSTPKQEPPS
jgi:hypothetical protein